jgi:hypothetical protein
MIYGGRGKRGRERASLAGLIDLQMQTDGFAMCVPCRAVLCGLEGEVPCLFSVSNGRLELYTGVVCGSSRVRCFVWVITCVRFIAW